MSRNIVHKAAGIAMTAVMALTGCMGQIGGIVQAEDIAGAGDTAYGMAEETDAPENEPCYYLTLPKKDHLEYAFQEEHIYIPDPDDRTDEEKKDILLTYREGDEVEVGLTAAEGFQAANARLLNEEKEERDFEWKDEATIQFRMPAEDLKLEVVLEERVLIEEQIAPDPDNTTEETANAPPVGDPSGSGQSGMEEMNTDSSGEEMPGTDPAVEDLDAQPSVTYIPDKDPDGLPVQGSIEQTETLDVILNDAGFDPKIDFRNVPYDPTIYQVEHISDDINLASPGTYSCIYKVTAPQSGKFFFVLRPVRVVEEMTLAAPLSEGTGKESNAKSEENETEGSDMNPETMPQSEEETEPETEPGSLIAAEDGSDETEMDETENPGAYRVSLVEGEDLGVELNHLDGMYNAGETVSFTVEESDNVLVAASAYKEESNENTDTADILYSEISYQEDQDAFSFEMPSENVALSVTRDEELGGMMLMAAADDGESWDDQTDVEAGSYYYFSDGKLHPFNSDMGSGGNDSYKYVRYKVDGKTFTVNAYCMQHSMTSPPSGTTYKKMVELDEGGDDRYLRKAIFYGYGGPGWGDTFNGYNIKTIMKTKYGVGSEMRAMQHYLVDYLYDGESGFGGALSTKAKNMLKEVKKALKNMPDPGAVSLSPSLSVKATGLSSPSFRWNADPAYILTIALESGVVLVNESTGITSSGTSSVSGGQSFHLEATGGTFNLKGEYTLTCNYPFDFHAMLLKLKNSQDIGFGYYTGGSLKLSVDWPKAKPIEVQKYDKESGLASPNNTACTFAGAEYSLYSDSGCTNLLETMTLNGSGYAKSANAYVMGTYYLKETKAPTGYNLDPTVYSCEVKDDATMVVHVDSTDQVIRGNVSITKYFDDDVDASLLQDWINNGKLEGIRFTLTHEDPAVEPITIITDKYGNAKTDERSMVYGTWTISEDESTTPEEYESLKAASFKIEEEGVTLSYVVSNQMIFVRLQINKRDADTGSLIPIRGAQFKLLDSDGNAIEMPDNLDYSKVTDTFTTNEEGVIILTNRLKYGTYTIKETYAPDGYLLSDPVEITLNKGNADNRANFVIEYPDRPQKGRVRITKIDRDTGKTCGEGFSFDIYTAAAITDAAGKPYTMDVDGMSVELDGAGIRVGTITTDTSGIALSDELYLGSYIIKETASAQYYAVDDTEYPVELTFDRNADEVIADLEIADEKTKFDLYKVDSENEDLPLEGVAFRMFSSSDVEAEKARQVAEAVEAKRSEQQVLKEDFIKKQAMALESYSAGEGITQEDIDAYRMGQEKEALDYEASLEAEVTALETELMATLEVTDTSALGEEYVTDENGHIHVEDLLHGNTYTIYEIRTLPGYNMDTAIYEFTVDDKGLIDGKSSYEIRIANVPNIVDISKKDITGEGELPGATLTIKDADGNVIDTWVSEETPHRIRALPSGTYTLTEEQAPECYALAEDIEFTVTDSLEIQTVVMYDEKLEIHFSKKSITGQEELPGAHLTLTDIDGNVIDDWVSTEEEHIINLKVGTYTLTEIQAPERYATAEAITFEVKPDLSVQSVEMLDSPLTVEVSKTDITTGEELPGAHMTITDADGNIVDEWDSTEEPHTTTLSLGEYTLTEVAAPERYSRAESVAFTVTDTAEIQKVEMKDKLIEVEISKKDLTNGQELPGAQLSVTDSEGNIIEEWTSTDTPHMMNLPTGEYTLTEVMAPERYAKAESIVFTVTDSAEVQKVEMKDKLIEVEISKKDITNEKELPGAHLIIKDKAGRSIDEWTSTDTPHMVNLPAGDYTLVEVTAPNGYDVAETVRFTVTDSMEVQHVVMYDSPKDDVVDLTGKKKRSTTPGRGITGGMAAPVKTGDYNRYLLPLLTMGLSGALMGVLLYLRRKDRKRRKRG